MCVFWFPVHNPPQLQAPQFSLQESFSVHFEVRFGPRFRSFDPKMGIRTFSWSSNLPKGLQSSEDLPQKKYEIAPGSE